MKEPAPNEPGAPGPEPGATLPPLWILLTAVLMVELLSGWLTPVEKAVLELPYSTFKEQLRGGNVERVVVTGSSIRGRFQKEVSFPPLAGEEKKTPGASREFATRMPPFADPVLEILLEEKGVRIEVAAEKSSVWLHLLLNFGPVVVLLAFFLWLGRRSPMGRGELADIGQSRAKRYRDEVTRVTFEDVAGIDDAEEELRHIVNFLRDPAKYGRLGGTMPKGVLLVGAPGTGKTLLARAIAGEARVPFFSLSASEFIELFVGVGAARVRDLFAQARRSAPSIIFIDELDAIGRSRSVGPSLGGHEEREQTLDQILAEMDGFDSRQGVIVLAATNRAEVLDPALLRPGRFDRRIVIQLPDRAGRAAILKVHTRKIPLAADVSLEELAAETPGLAGADLKNLVNEAALLAARQGAESVRRQDLVEAIQKIALGPARHVLLSPQDRERTAFHESGHALVALLTPGNDPVRRMSIIPRGPALGATYQLPRDDRTSLTEAYLRSRMASALGGRAAEEIVFGCVTTGSENDLQQVTELARTMVTRWGMSPRLGPVVHGGIADDGLPPALRSRPYSEDTARMIDGEIRRLVDECHQEASHLLSVNRPRLDALAAALLRSETLDENEILEAAGLHPRSSPEESTGSRQSVSSALAQGHDAAAEARGVGS